MVNIYKLKALCSVFTMKKGGSCKLCSIIPPGRGRERKTGNRNEKAFQVRNLWVVFQKMEECFECGLISCCNRFIIPCETQSRRRTFTGRGHTRILQQEAASSHNGSLLFILECVCSPLVEPRLP